MSADIKTYPSYHALKNAYERDEVTIHQPVRVLYPHYTNSLFLENFELDNRHANPTLANIIPTSNSNTLPVPVATYKLPQSTKNQPEFVTSTVGRFIFNEYIPQNLGYVDRTLSPHELEIDKIINNSNKLGVDSDMINEIVYRATKTLPHPQVVFLLDSLKDMGYKYATVSGLSLSVIDIVPVEKAKDLAEGVSKVAKLEDKLNNNKLTPEQFEEKKLLLWTEINERVNDRAMKTLPPSNPIKKMAISGSRGNKQQITQMNGMRGIMKDATGKKISNPVMSSFIEGLDMEEYYTASYGARSGIYDRTNGTKSTGEATRNDGYGLEDIVITMGDCGDQEGIVLEPLHTLTPDDPHNKTLRLSKRVQGRITLQDIIDPISNKTLSPVNYPIPDAVLPVIDQHYESLKVRSQMSCKAAYGICAKCYGHSFIDGHFSTVGMPIGNITAQTVNERGTQLMMRTFHTGGVASGQVTNAFSDLKRLKQTTNYPEAIKAELAKLEKITHADIELMQEGKFLQKALANHNIQTPADYHNVNSPRDISFTELNILRSDVLMNIRRLIADSLQRVYFDNNIKTHDVYFETYAKAMTERLLVISPGDSSIAPFTRLKFGDMLVANIELAKDNLNTIIAVPDIMNMKETSIAEEKALTAIGYRNIAAVLPRMAMMGAEDNLTNPSSAIVTANLLPTGRLGHKLAHERIFKNKSPIPTRFEMDELLKQYLPTTPVSTATSTDPNAIPSAAINFPEPTTATTYTAITDILEWESNNCSPTSNPPGPESDTNTNSITNTDSDTDIQIDQDLAAMFSPTSSAAPEAESTDSNPTQAVEIDLDWN